MTDTRAAFHAMEHGTADDWAIITQASAPFVGALPDRILDHLRMLANDHGGFAVDRLTHSLQTAARAERDGRSDEYIFCALLHDIGDNLGSFNHSDVAAAVVKPFVAPELHWMVEQHGEFQGYFFFHHLGLDRNMRERHRGHVAFDLTVEFCAEFDGPAFDPSYPTPALEHFEPLVRSLMAAPKRTIYMSE